MSNINILSCGIVNLGQYEPLFTDANLDKFVTQEEASQYDSIIYWCRLLTSDIVYIGIVKNYGYCSYITMVFKDYIPGKLTNMIIDHKDNYIIESIVQPDEYECVHDNIYIKKIYNGFVYNEQYKKDSAIAIGCLQSTFGLMKIKDKSTLKNNINFYIKAGINKLIIAFVDINRSIMIDTIRQCKLLDVLIVIDYCELQTKDSTIKSIEYTSKVDNKIDIVQSKCQYLICPKNRHYKYAITDFFGALSSKNLVEYSKNPLLTIINLNNYDF